MYTSFFSSGKEFSELKRACLLRVQNVVYVVFSGGKLGYVLLETAKNSVNLCLIVVSNFPSLFAVICHTLMAYMARKG